MRAAAVAAVALLSACAVAGCRATPTPQANDMALDMAASTGDLAGGGDDLAVADMACPVGPEICNNGCDDDRNGYTDADDPACTTQMIVTLGGLGSANLSRLILEPTPHLAALDGNPVSGGGMAAFNAAFAPAAFIVYDGSTKKLERRPLGGASTTFFPGYSTRDVCVFNGELIVVDYPATSRLHRFAADGKTEILPPVTLTGAAAGCASDGNSLFVARHTGIGASEVVIFDKSANGPVPSTLPPIPIPDALLNAGYDRILDLAYVKKSGIFIGLFAVGSGGDSTLDGTVMAPWSPDGGAGAFIDGGIWHGVGEFLP
jgi:hypothetical protein